MTLALRLVQLAARCLPPHRRAWGEAMRRELPLLPRADALPWAFGCLSAACLERIRILRDVSAISRLGLSALAASLGGLPIVFGDWHWNGHAQFGLLFFLVLQGVMYCVAAFALARRQSRLLIETLVILVCTKAVFVAAINPFNALAAGPGGALPEILGIIVGAFAPTIVLTVAAAIVWRLPGRSPVAA